MFLTLTATRKL